MNLDEALNLLSKIKNNPSKWELETIIWNDRNNNPETLKKLLLRLNELNQGMRTEDEEREYSFLLEIIEDMDKYECEILLSNTDTVVRDTFIEDLARKCAIETLALGKISVNLLNLCCKLSPNDFILCAKRTQDLIDAIHGLVIKGENLSRDIASS